jgi:hypothetical protein
MLFVCTLFWNDKCDHAFVEWVVVGVNQIDAPFVRPASANRTAIDGPASPVPMMIASKRFMQLVRPRR